MDKNSLKKCVFSGRFDRFHAGHWISILRLLKEFPKVIVVILDYPGRRWPTSYIKQIFDELVELSDLKNRVEILINSTHFAKIKKIEWEALGADIYASGNMEVLKHIDTLGVPTIYVDRAFDFEASNYTPSWELEKKEEKAMNYT